MFHCQDCIKCFVTSHARDQHCDAKRHNFPGHGCDTCGAHFGSKEARQQHMSAKRHSHGGSSFECYLCSAIFAAKSQYTDHMADAHLCCAACHRTFVDSNSIKQVSPRRLPRRPADYMLTPLALAPQCHHPPRQLFPPQHRPQGGGATPRRSVLRGLHGCRALVRRRVVGLYLPPLSPPVGHARQPQPAP